MGLSPTHRVWSYSIVMCLTGYLFGSDTGSIGSITQMPQFIAHFGQLSEFMRGFVVSCILIPSALTGIAAGRLQDRISRKYTVSLGAAIFAVGSAISCGAPNLVTLIVARCIAGSGEGLFLSAATTYLCEIGPKHLRGRLICCFQLFIAGGVALGFFICYGTIKIQTSFAWRLPFIISTCIAMIAAVGCWFLPFSPRWLCSVGRRDDAEGVLNLVTGSGDEEERRELLAVPPTNSSLGFLHMFSKGVRGRTFLGTFLNVFQQLTGIDFVLFYAPLLFSQAGLDPKTSSFIASGVTGIVLLIATGAGTFYVDKIGRRTIILWGGSLVASCLLVIDASDAHHTAAGRWSAIVLIELYTVFFSGSWALTIRLYAAEIQPSQTRAAASSFGQGANQLMNTVVALTSPAFLASSPSGPYFLYGGLTAFATLVAWLCMPETLGKSLESIDSTFEGSAVTVAWPIILRSRSNTLRNRRPSRRQSSSHADSEGRPSFPQRIGMERLGSDALVGSAIEEE